MRYRIWRSLDKSASFFGIKGSYMIPFLLLAAISLIAAVLVGKALGTLFGMLAFAVAAGTAYITILSLQGKMSDKTFSRSLNKGRYPKFIRITPESIRSMKKEVSV